MNLFKYDSFKKWTANQATNMKKYLFCNIFSVLSFSFVKIVAGFHAQTFFLQGNV